MLAQDNNFVFAKENCCDMIVFLQIVTTGKNSLNNRFLPFTNIETEAILTVDDDQKIPLGEIQLAFRYSLTSPKEVPPALPLVI